MKAVEEFAAKCIHGSFLVSPRGEYNGNRSSDSGGS